MDRWKAFAVLGWSLVGVVLLAGAGDKDTVVARKVVIHDARGKTVLQLGETAGKAYMNFFGPPEVCRLSVSLDDRGTPYVVMSDPGEGIVLSVTGHPDAPRVVYKALGGEVKKLKQP